MDTDVLKQQLMNLKLDELESILIKLGKEKLVLQEKIINILNEGEEK